MQHKPNFITYTHTHTLKGARRFPHTSCKLSNLRSFCVAVELIFSSVEIFETQRHIKRIDNNNNSSKLNSIDNNDSYGDSVTVATCMCFLDRKHLPSNYTKTVNSKCQWGPLCSRVDVGRRQRQPANQR